MSCLDTYIGLRICGGETSESGLFINSLPGISLESIAASADAEQITYAGVWKDVLAEAYTRLYTDFVNELLKCFTLQPYCDYDAIICANKAKLAQAWKYLLGNQLMVFRIYTDRLNRFTTVDLGKAKELRDFYDGEYREALQMAAQIADTSECDCMDCGGNPQTVTWLP